MVPDPHPNHFGNLDPKPRQGNEPDPDPQKNQDPHPDPYKIKNDKSDLDPYHCDPDPQHCDRGWEDVCEVQHSVLPVLLGAAGGERGEARHEEVETREGDHVHRQLTQVSVQLPREPQASRHS